MKRCMLFSGYNYYPSGGIDDYKGVFDTFEEMCTHGNFKEWFNCFDTQTGKRFSSFIYSMPSNGTQQELIELECSKMSKLTIDE